jgi:sucrose phosphorylase
VRRLLELIRLRNTHPAFEGTLDVDLIDDIRLGLAWRAGSSSYSLEVDLSAGHLTVDDGRADGWVARCFG